MPGEPTKDSRSVTVVLALALAAAAALPYLQSLGFAFLEYDDGKIVYENPDVLAGLSAEGIAGIFGRPHFGLYNPVTLLTHALDVELWELGAGGHHLTSTLWHALNALLCFLALRRLTGSRWRSVFAAALFALHPMRAEAVAWVASRKDLVCAAFVFLALIAYAGYARKPAVWRYLVVALCFVLGLLAKPMAVTLPLLLLLLDWWPLQRMHFAPGWPKRAAKLVAEKLPLFALSLAGAALAVWSQRVLGTLAAAEHISPGTRLYATFWGYLRYLGLFFWPAGISIHDPLPPLGSINPLTAAAPAVILAGITAVSLLAARYRYLATGWLWFLIALVPVSGIVQFGNAAIAGRFTYLPHVGLCIAFSWGVSQSLGPRRRLATALAAPLLVAAAGWTWHVAGYWRDTETAFERVLELTPWSSIALNKKGELEYRQGKLKAAEATFRRALRYQPGDAEAHYNLGSLLLERAPGTQPEKVLGEAIGHLEHAVALQPGDCEAWANLGIAGLNQALRVPGAAPDYLEPLARSVQLCPGSAANRINYGLALTHAGHWEEARVQARAAAGLAPTDPGLLDRLRNLEQIIAHGRPRGGRRTGS